MPILYPFVLECCKDCKEPFIKTVFEEIAQGKAPSGTRITDDHMLVSPFGSCNLAQPDYTQIMSLINEVIRKGKKDLQNVLLRYYQNAEEKKNSYTKWSDIRKKSVKMFLLEEYALTLQHKLGMSDNETRKFFESLLRALDLKTITTKDVVYDPNTHCVSQVRGVEMRNGKVYVVGTKSGSSGHSGGNLSLSVMFLSASNKDVPKKIDPVEVWNSYVQRINDFREYAPVGVAVEPD